MKTLRLPFGLGGVVGLGCAAWAVCLVAGLAGEARAQYADTIEVPVTFYDFRSDRSNPEFEQPHTGGKNKTTGLVMPELDADGKPVANPSVDLLNAGIRFWFRDNSKLSTSYKQTKYPTGITADVGSGGNYLAKFRPIYKYGSANPPGIEGAAPGNDEWGNRPTWQRNEYTETDLGNKNYSVDTAYKNTVIPAKLVFSHTNSGIYKFESSKFFPLVSGNPTWISETNRANKVIFNGTSPTVLPGQSWKSNGSKGNTNYSYTMELVTDFQMGPDLTFSFRGDDDVWLFINNRLVNSVDIGGIHEKQDGSVNLNTLRTSHNLQDKSTYKMHLFYCERHSDDANILITTNIISVIPSEIELTIPGGDITAGVDKKVTATVVDDTGGVRQPPYPGDFTWTVVDQGGYNTTTGSNPTLTVKSATNLGMTKTHEVNVNAQKAYTWVKLTACYKEGSAKQVCKDTLMWVKPGDPDKVWIEGAQDSLPNSQSIRNAQHLERIRIGQDVYVENFYGIVRDKFGNWVSRAGTGAGFSGRAMTWKALDEKVALGKQAEGNANFINGTANNVAKVTRGQGRVDRVAKGSTKLYSDYTWSGFTIKRDTTIVDVDDVIYDKIRVVVKQGNTYVPLAGDNPTVVMPVRSDTTLYVELHDPLADGGKGTWVQMPATWVNVNNSVPDVAAPSGTSNSWTLNPKKPTAPGGGTITASSNGQSVTVKIVVEQKDPAIVRIFTKRGEPKVFTHKISTYTKPGSSPDTSVRGYVEPEEFVIVTAGATLPLVGKLFSEKAPPTTDTWLKDLEDPKTTAEKNRWKWEFVAGSPTNANLNGGNALSGTGDSATFNSTVAHLQYRVRITYTPEQAGVAPVQQEIIISVVPDLTNPKVTIESEWQLTTANQNRPQKVSELAFADGDSLKNVYAILRDQYGNYIAPSGAAIPPAYGLSGVTIQKPSWSPTVGNNSIVLAINGQVTQGQGNVIRTGFDGPAVWVYVTDKSFPGNIKDSVQARLLKYYYEDIKIVVECKSSNMGVPGYCSVPSDGVELTTNDTTSLYVIGKCNDGNCEGKSQSGWELVPGDWGRDAGLNNALTTPPSGTNNWTLRPNSTGDGFVKVKRPGPGGVDLEDSVYVTITAGVPTRAEIKIITPPDQRIAGQPIKFEITYFNNTGEMKEWNPAWANDSAYFADILKGMGITTVEPKVVDGFGGQKTLFYVGKDGRVNAQLTHALVNGKDVVTIYIYNATDNPHQIKYKETVVNNKLEAVSEQFTVLPGAPKNIIIEGPGIKDCENGSGRCLDVDYNDKDFVLRVIAVDEWGNKVGDYPSDWKADNPVLVNNVDRPIIVYTPGTADGNGCGLLVVTGHQNQNLKDSLNICLTGFVEKPLYAITRDEDGCGYLDKIEMKFKKPIYFKDLSEATEKKPSKISVMWLTTVLTVDSVKVFPADSSVVLFLHDVSPHGGAPLQTGWTPAVVISKGILYTAKGDKFDVCGGSPTQTVGTVDGAAPVIKKAQIFQTKNKLVVTFSEKVKPPTGANFGANSEQLYDAYPPINLFNIWLKGQSKALQARTRALSKTSAADPEVSGKFDLQIDALKGIKGVYPTDTTLAFDMKDGISISNYINIRTSDQEKNKIDKTQIIDQAKGNVPLEHNRKVQITYGDVNDGTMKAIPNPASPDPNRVRDDGKKVEAGIIFADHDKNAVDDIKKGKAGGTVFEVTLYVPGALKDKNGNPLPLNDQPKVKCQLKVYDLAGNLVIAGQSADAMRGVNLGETTKLHLYWNGYNAKKMKVAPGTYRMVVYISYTNVGDLSPEEQALFKDNKYTSLVGISK